LNRGGPDWRRVPGEGGGVSWRRPLRGGNGGRCRMESRLLQGGERATGKVAATLARLHRQTRRCRPGCGERLAPHPPCGHPLPQGEGAGAHGVTRPTNAGTRRMDQAWRDLGQGGAWGKGRGGEEC
jgi:hypothetical protein